MEDIKGVRSRKEEEVKRYQRGSGVVKKKKLEDIKGVIRCRKEEEVGRYQRGSEVVKKKRQCNDRKKKDIKKQRSTKHYKKIEQH